MSKTLSLYHARTNLFDEAAAGAEIVIAKHGKPKARLVALAEAARPRRQAGLYARRVRIHDDFDAPWPEDIRRALEGENPIEPDDASTSG